MPKNLILDDCSPEQAEQLCQEIGKVRCWLTGYRAGSRGEGPPGEDALRQIQVILKNSISKLARTGGATKQKVGN